MRYRSAFPLLVFFVLSGCASSTQTVDRTNPELTEESVMAAQAAGYTLVTRNGEQVVCRRDPQTGSRLRHTIICLSAREWMRVRSSAREALQDVSGGHKPACQAGATC